MYSNYYKLYNQCQQNPHEIISNTKFLNPDSPVYYDLSLNFPEKDIRNITHKKRGNVMMRPEDLKFKPHSVADFENELEADQTQKLVENFMVPPKDYSPSKAVEMAAPRCRLCRMGSEELSGATFYGPSDKIINQEIQKNPGICNAPVYMKKVGPFEKAPKEWPIAVGGKYIPQVPVVENFEQTTHNAQNLLRAREIWGPVFWEMLHAITFAYPENPSEEEKRAAYNFFVSLPYMLPCAECRVNCQNKICDNGNPGPPDVSCKQHLSNWLVNLHNQANIMLNKRAIPYEEVCNRYQGYQMCSEH